MKTVIIGDIHGRQSWKEIISQNEDANSFIYLADYFDSFDIKWQDQVSNFLDIIAFKESTDKEVIMLIGNHDHHYFKFIGPSGTSGFNEDAFPTIAEVLETHGKHLQMAFDEGDVLFTHAGVSEIWIKIVEEKIPTLKEAGPYKSAETIAALVNEVWKHKPELFKFNGRDPYGDNTYQTPIWIRPRSLMHANGELKKNIIQVVGHTGQASIDIEGKSTGGRYYFIDTLGTSREYLILEDGKFSVGNL